METKLSTLSSFVPTEPIVETTQPETTQQEQVIPENAAPIETQEAATQDDINSDNEASFELGGEQPTTTASSVVNDLNPKEDWKEILRKLDKKEVAKELGINDFALELNEHLSKGGNASDYLNAKAIDYNKVSDADMIISELKKDYPDATQQQLEKLFNKKYSQTDLADDEDKELGALQIAADARKVRQAKIAEQQAFKMPEGQSNKDLELQIQQQLEEQQNKVEQTIQYYQNHEATKSLMQSKRVAVPLGDLGKFNFKIDNPDVITRAMIDGDTWQKMVSTSQGEPDVQKQQLIGLFASNPEYFCKTLVNYGKSFGERKLVEEGQNAKKPGGVAATMVEDTPTYKLGTGAR